MIVISKILRLILQTFAMKTISDKEKSDIYDEKTSKTDLNYTTKIKFLRFI